MPDLIFTEEDHCYLVDGTPKISVTTALKGMMNHEYATEWHRDRGSFTHKMIALYLQDELDESVLDPQLVPYMEAFMKFERDTGFEAQGWEIPMYNPKWDYVGTPDVWGTFLYACPASQLALLDVKTGAPSPADPPQLGAYWDLLRVNGTLVMSAQNLYLKDNGRYNLGERLEYRDLMREFGVFLEQLTNYRKERGM